VSAPVGGRVRVYIAASMDGFIAGPGGDLSWLPDPPEGSELAQFHRQNDDTRVYVHRVIVDGADFAVEWQFAATDRATGARTAVGDAIIGAVRDGRIVLWKEYLDGRIFALQRDGTLLLDEGEEPFPWPRVP